MTSSTEKRSKRKKSKLYKVINRASRINIIKEVRKILEDGLHLPISHAKIVEKPANETKKEETIKRDSLIYTPYGTFSKYEQDELLDQYQSEATGDKQSEITIKVPSIPPGDPIVASKMPQGFKNALRKSFQRISEGVVNIKDRAKVSVGTMGEKIIGLKLKAAPGINRLKNFIKKSEDSIAYFRLLAKEKFIELMSYTQNNRKKLRIISGVMLMAVITGTLFIGSISGYDYFYNDKLLGTVKNQNDVYITVDVIGDKLDKEYNAKIVMDKDKNISLKRVIGLNLKLDSREEVLNKFTYLKDMEVMAYAITVDGKQVALMDSKENAEEILAQIQNTYLKKSDRIKYDKVGFAEKVVIEEALTKLRNLKDKNDIVDFMLTGAIEKKKHVVKSGETFSGIASAYSITQAQLRGSNPEVIPEKLHIGQELVLTAAAPVLTVQTIETAEYDQSISYTIKYENTEAKYKGEQSVKNKGVDGKKKVVAQIVRNNGIEVKRTELSSVVAFEPVAQVVLVGTKKLPPLVGTGTYIIPTRGVITSRFGTRWGRLHEGIDIGVPVGTAVKAADGGTVIFAGRDGGYGNVIRINHGGNRVTVYAHCSKLLVKKGTKVFQGQHIANSGNTGSSTGPHLHFEIRINGRPVNPSKYL